MKIDFQVIDTILINNLIGGRRLLHQSINAWGHPEKKALKEIDSKKASQITSNLK
jgi:hypothetical protein